MKTFTIKTAWNQYGQLMGNVLGHDRESLEQDHAQYQIVQPAASVKDYMWGLFNRMLLESAGDFHTQSMLYHCMAVFRGIYEGKSGKQYNQLSHQASLDKIRIDNESSRLVIELKVSPDPDCPHAKSMENKRFPIETDLVSMLANESCHRDFCRCNILGLAKRDEDGNLLKK